MHNDEQKRLIHKISEYDNLDSRLNDLLSEVNNKLAELKKLQIEIDKNNSETKEQIKKEKNDIQKIISEKTIGFPWLADAISQYYESRDLKIAEFMENKLRPGLSSADRIRELSKDKMEFQKKFILARNISKYYESLFPWLTDFVDESIDEVILKAFTIEEISDDDVDPVNNYLTKGEFQKLSVTERNQLALDRYWKRKKTPWEIGRDYERYIGYLYEKEGWIVNYQGIEKGLEDLGRDLICKRGNTIEIVQCKYWRSERTIHEKHINQLFGTTVEYYIKNLSAINTKPQIDLFSGILGNDFLKAKFITSCSFSETSKIFAKALGIEIIEKFPLDDYPIIKCNVSRRDNSKIYHLPFDQQYDKTIIEEERNECYVGIVKEAERLGFRRAWRWEGSNRNGL